MSVQRSQFQFVATTGLGMEGLLASELCALGLPAIDPATQIKGTTIRFSSTLEFAYRVCLWSRIANRVLLPLKTFQASDPDQMYAGVRSIHWTDHLTTRDTLAVDFSSSQSQISHTHYGALKVKDAIVDQFRSVKGERPSVDPARPSVRINVYVHQDNATVSIDLSGESLHRRGYRAPNMPAPLKENLAASLIAYSGWPEESFQAFLDPMCGSGTLPIEAGMMAAGIAPGLGREYFGFLGWQGHVPAVWGRLVQEAKAKQQELGTSKKRLPKVVGYDRDFRAVRVALEAVERAGLRGIVHIEKREMTQCEKVADRGIFMTNPPYGERLGGVEELKGLYKAIGDQMKQKFKGWDGYVFTGSSELCKVIGLKPARKVPFFNGAIECRLMKYSLY